MWCIGYESGCVLAGGPWCRPQLQDWWWTIGGRRAGYGPTRMSIPVIRPNIWELVGGRGMRDPMFLLVSLNTSARRPSRSWASNGEQGGPPRLPLSTEEPEALCLHWESEDERVAFRLLAVPGSPSAAILVYLYDSKAVVFELCQTQRLRGSKFQCPISGRTLRVYMSARKLRGSSY